MKQPRAIYLLIFVQMWECFSFYGMRALLVLYMIDSLAFAESTSFGIYAIYTSMVEMCVLAGGCLADRVLGLRITIFLGAILITCGHLFLAFSTYFFEGLAFIVVGSSLFKTNLKALLGLFYENNHLQREAGFTLFYSGTNLGGLLATLLCGYIGHCYGWHAGFGLAAIGMTIGLILWSTNQRLLANKGESTLNGHRWRIGVGSIAIFGLIPLVARLLQKNQLSLFFLPLIGIGAMVHLFFQIKTLPVDQKKPIHVIIGMTFLVMVYFAVEELMGSLLMVFSNAYVSKSIFHIQVPASVLLTMNPFTIILMGPLIARLSLRAHKKLQIAFFCLSSAFALLYFSCHEESISPLVLIVSFAAIALGELFLVPTTYAYCSKWAPPYFKGILMSLVTMGFAYGSLISGTVIQYINPHSLPEYKSFFLYTTMIAIMFPFVIFFIYPFHLKGAQVKID